MDSVSMRAHVFRLWHFFFNGYSVSFGRRPTFKVCFISSGHAHSSASCAGKLLVDVFFFFFSKYVEEKSVTAAGFVPVEFIACMLQPIQTDSACSHLCTDWSIFRVSAGKSAHLGATAIPLALFVEILL